MVNQVLDQWDECGQILIGGGRGTKKNNGTLIILRLNFSWAVDKVSFIGLNLDFCERRKFLQKLNFVFNITYSIK